MNENDYHRRGLIKLGITLIGGVMALGAVRSSIGATKKVESKERARKIRRGYYAARHCIEGKRLDLPKQDPRTDKC